MSITYKKDGIVIDGNFIGLGEILEKCNLEKIKEENLILLKIKWKGHRGFDGVFENMTVPANNIEAIKEIITSRNISFGEIAGKHSEIYGTIDKEDIEIIDNLEEINNFLLECPGGHEYNYSFLSVLHDHIMDEVYDDLSKEDAGRLWDLLYNK